MSGMGDVKLADQLLDQYQRQKSLDEEIRSKYPEYEKMYGESFWRKPISESYDMVSPSPEEMQDIINNLNSDPRSLVKHHTPKLSDALFQAKRGVEARSSNNFANSVRSPDPIKFLQKLKTLTPDDSIWEYYGAIGEQGNPVVVDMEQPVGKDGKLFSVPYDKLPFNFRDDYMGQDFTNYPEKFVQIDLGGKQARDALLHEYGHVLSTKDKPKFEGSSPEAPLYDGLEMWGDELKGLQTLFSSPEQKYAFDENIVRKNFPRMFKAMTGAHFHTPGVPMDENKIGGNELSFSWEYPQKVLKKGYISQGLEQGIPEKMEKYKSLKPIFKDK